MTRGRLVWSPEAEADLADIWDYYAGVAGRRTADNIVRAVGDALRLIEIIPAADGRDEVRPGLRSIAASPHVIFYRGTKDDIAQIVRVLDGRRDIEAIFDEPEPP